MVVLLSAQIASTLLGQIGLGRIGPAAGAGQDGGTYKSKLSNPVPVHNLLLHLVNYVENS